VHAWTVDTRPLYLPHPRLPLTFSFCSCHPSPLLLLALLPCPLSSSHPSLPSLSCPLPAFSCSPSLLPPFPLLPTSPPSSSFLLSHLPWALFLPNPLPFFLTANRTEPNLKDLALAFADLGINVAELSEFCQEVESTKPPQGIPKYPMPRKLTHVNLSATARVVTRKQVSRSSRSSSTSSDEEEDYIPSYLPPLPSKLTEKGESTVTFH